MPYLIGSIGDSTPEPAPLRDNWWLIALRGAAAILFGVGALMLPSETFFVLVLLFAALCLLDGVVNLALAIRCAKSRARWGGLALHAFFSLCIGAGIFFYPPIVAVALVALFALWAVVSGVLMIDLAIDRAHRSARVMLGAVGGFHLVFGLFLLVSPFIGVFVLTWWIGLNAIVVGCALVAFAWGLKGGSSRRRSTPATA